MNSLGVSACLLCVVVAASSANAYRLGGCPRVVVMKTIDFDRFLGDWYVVQRFNPLATCIKVSFDKGPEDQYSVNETTKPFGVHFNYHTRYVPARKLKFLRNDTNSIFRLQKNFAHFSLSTFGVVDTDYDTYAVIWGCDPVLFGSTQNVDILSRERTPSQDLIKKARDSMREMNGNVDIHSLENVDQTRCETSSEKGEKSPNEGDRNTNNIVIEGP